jgi:hypothetical protein
VVSWSEFLATDPEARVRFPALPDFLKEQKKKENSSGSGTGSTQPHEYNSTCTLYPQKVGNHFADKLRSLGRYSSLADSGHGVFLYSWKSEVWLN